jgi:2-methylcitrate dehydratase PrpD
MAKVTVGRNATCDEIYPHQFPAVLTVRLAGGEEIVEKVLTNRGGPDRPLSATELTEKFRDNARRRFPEAAVETVRSRVDGLAELDDVRALVAPFGEG